MDDSARKLEYSVRNCIRLAETRRYAKHVIILPKHKSIRQKLDESAPTKKLDYFCPNLDYPPKKFDYSAPNWTTPPKTGIFC